MGFQFDEEAIQAVMEEMLPDEKAWVTPTQVAAMAERIRNTFEPAGATDRDFVELRDSWVEAMRNDRTLAFLTQQQMQSAVSAICEGLRVPALQIGKD